jgi:hypothetical protein
MMFRSSHRRSIAAVAALVAGACVAAGPQTSDLPTELVGEFRSAPGESLDAFMVDVGGVLHAFSARTQFEACGWVGVSADHTRYGVVAYTNRSHIACNSRGADVPADLSPLPFTIHSHPTQTGLQLNRADRMALNLLGNGAVVAGLQRSASAPATVHVVADGFNPGDYSRPGYLAASGGVWFQNGAGTDRFVGAYRVSQP